MKNTITSRSTDFSKWYLDIIAAAELADNSPVRGCMVIRPNGYAIWEKMQGSLDGMFRSKGIQNAYFPMLIPKSFFEKEAEHVEGFAKECAVVTHHRLKFDETNKLVVAGLLEEPLIIRPTSETIINTMYSKWISSFRDLPLKLNQWVNVVRWELRTRPFLRTTEFLWQEGHTAHSTREEADEMTLQMLDVYGDFFERILAIPVIKGMKSESEKFAGAVYTTCVEAMMQDGKALQVGTSHMLGQNFAVPFDIKFTDREGRDEYVWQTSWGVSTRIIGALIMTHSDDKGLILPPRIAPIPIVVVPIWGKEEEKTLVIDEAKKIAENVTSELGLVVHLDEREGRPGPKFYEWEKKGIPLRLEIGPREIAERAVVLVRRDNGQKMKIANAALGPVIKEVLETIQNDLFARASEYRRQKTHEANSYIEMERILGDKANGFVSAPWCGNSKCESKVKEDTMATIRSLPFAKELVRGSCVVCGKEAAKQAIFAKAY
jgi:prolyl-tRNA synthetase